MINEMIMKRKSCVLLMAMVAIVLSLGFVSCSDDDEEGGSGSLPANLVGVWRNVAAESGEYTYFIIQANSAHFRYSPTLEDDYGEDYALSYDASTQTLELVDNGEDAFTWHMRVVSLTNQQLVLEYIDENPGTRTFMRVE